MKATLLAGANFTAAQIALLVTELGGPRPASNALKASLELSLINLVFHDASQDDKNKVLCNLESCKKTQEQMAAESVDDLTILACAELDQDNADEMGALAQAVKKRAWHLSKNAQPTTKKKTTKAARKQAAVAKAKQKVKVMRRRKLGPYHQRRAAAPAAAKDHDPAAAADAAPAQKEAAAAHVSSSASAASGSTTSSSSSSSGSSSSSSSSSGNSSSSSGGGLAAPDEPRVRGPNEHETPAGVKAIIPAGSSLSIDENQNRWAAKYLLSLALNSDATLVR
jgi:hypothetical protein